MATPIAHKGIQAGAKVVALTVIDFLGRISGCISCSSSARVK